MDINIGYTCFSGDSLNFQNGRQVNNIRHNVIRKNYALSVRYMEPLISDPNNPLFVFQRQDIIEINFGSMIRVITRGDYCRGDSLLMAQW